MFILKAQRLIPIRLRDVGLTLYLLPTVIIMEKQEILILVRERLKPYWMNYESKEEAAYNKGLQDAINILERVL